MFKLSASDNFTIHGIMKNAPDTLCLKYNYGLISNDTDSVVEDSVMVINGIFQIDGKINGMTFFNIMQKKSGVSFCIEPCEMWLEIDADRPYYYQLKGTTFDHELKLVRDKMTALDSLYDDCMNRIFDPDLNARLANEDVNFELDTEEARRDFFHLINRRKRILAERDSIMLEIANENISFKIVPHLLYLIIAGGRYAGEAFVLYEQLPENVKKKSISRLTERKIAEEKKRIEEENKTAVGRSAPDFNGKSYTNENVRLSDYVNKKVVLLDFWASWCVPCMRNMPKLKELFNEYKDYGLEIIGISLDSDSEVWIQTISQNGMEGWTHILEEMDDGGKLSDIYNVDVIPTYILIDKCGTIVGRWNVLKDENIKTIADFCR